MSSAQTFYPLQAGQTPGLVIIVMIASLSVFALTFLALRALWLVASPIFRPNASQRVSKEHIFFQTQLGHYAACLLASNFFTSAAGVVVARWVADGGLREGMACTTQAILMQIGNFSTAYFTVVLALHTCTSLVFRFRQTKWAGATIIAVGWLSSIAIGFAPLKMGSGSQSTYGFDGFSCGIKRADTLPQFLFHLLPIFFAALVSAIVYSLIFLILRGTLSVKGGFKITLDPNERWSGRNPFEEYHRFIRAIARSMLWYPFAYLVLLLPYSVTKLLDVSGFSVSFGGNVFAEICAFMLGLVNVGLLYNTFRVLEPAFEARSNASTTRKSDLESFGNFGTSEKFGPPPPSLSVSAADITQYRTSGEGVLPSWSFPAQSNTAPSRTRDLTHQKSNSSIGANSSLRLLIPHQTRGHYASSSASSTSTESIGRAITPVSELNDAIVIEPARAFVKPGNGKYNAHLQPHLRSASADSMQSNLSLPPPPRRTKSPISRRPTLEKVQVNPISREPSVSSVSSSQRGSFGVRALPQPPHGRKTSQSSLRPMHKSSKSDLRSPFRPSSEDFEIVSPPFARTHGRQMSQGVASVLSGDFGANLRDGPSKTPSFSSGSINSNRTDLSHVRSSSAQHHPF